MRVYIADNYESRNSRAREVKTLLQAHGIGVTSRWLYLTGRSDREGAIADVEDVLKADYLVFMADQLGDTPARGKYVELGMMISEPHRILVVTEDAGKRMQECVFLNLKGILFCPKIEAIPAALFRMQARGLDFDVSSI